MNEYMKDVWKPFLTQGPNPKSKPKGWKAKERGIKGMLGWKKMKG